MNTTPYFFLCLRLIGNVISLTFFIVSCFSFSLFAQFATTSTDSIRLQGNLIGSEKERAFSHTSLWRFHQGDDTTGTWSQPNFDDSSWELISTRLYQDSLHPEIPILPRSYNGTGWFRLRLDIDFVLQQTPLVLSIYYTGQSEVYADGKLIAQLGTRNHNITHHVVHLPLENKKSVLVAVHYANLSAKEQLRIHRFLKSAFVDWSGVVMEIVPLELEERKQSERNLANTVESALGGVLMVLAILNTCLLLFQWRMYFGSLSLFALFSYCGFLWFTAFSSLLSVTSIAFFLNDNNLYEVINSISYSFSVVFSNMALFFYLQFVYNILNQKAPRYFIILVFLSVCHSLSVLLAGILIEQNMNFLLPHWLSQCFFVSLAIESIRISLIAYRHRGREKYLVIGNIFICALMLYLLFAPGIPQSYPRSWGTNLSINLPVPLIMTVLLAYHDAKTNRLLIEQNEKLEAEVQKRTFFIHQQIDIQNQQTQKIVETNSQLQEQNHALEALNLELEQANKFKNDVISMVSHDLRNPLTNLYLCISMITGLYPHDDKLDIYAKRILSSVDQMKELISGVLETTEILRGEIPIVRTTFNITQLVTEKAEQYMLHAHSKEQIIHFGDVLEEVYLHGDRQRLGQVFDNLLTNAIKYSPFGRKICISVLVIDNTDKQSNVGKECTQWVARVEIKDEGPGISEEDKAKMFGFFQRLTAKPTGGESSSGVGLAIVKSIVDLHQGNIWAESRESEGITGTTFIVELPISEDAMMLKESFHTDSEWQLRMLVSAGAGNRTRGSRGIDMVL